MAPPFTEARIEDSLKRIRVLFAGVYIIDTRKAKLVWESRYYPTYFFPHSDLSLDYVELTKEHPDGDKYDLKVNGKTAKEVVTVYSQPTHEHLQGLLKITFAYGRIFSSVPKITNRHNISAADAWFEEDEQIFVHPKDPYKRVDVLSSSRHIRVEVDGVEVANSRTPKLLFETGLPVRTYVPKTDCRMDLLVPSEAKTECPYKGEAHYYHIQLSPDKKFENVVWWYRNPNLECATIGGLVAFYDEKVDVFVDGIKQERPKSLWS
ncbi:hypothetical protein MIND_00258600 [Mycena indigotica]|uniref:DUF427 domain-containing protein n=1 Tax=Mycena indigotica TaxID=2126181 RepID=A0A8H6WDF6_9AGAR|nr:uncharacterized protein MIND_00258600 [Mycena indigotica]KAF7312451.1 hypothetical protein MIND_00258600 [Mycena indigotica]